MRKLFSFLCLGMILTLLFACKSEEDIPTGSVDNKYYTAAGSVSVLSEEAVQYLECLTEDGTTVVLKANTPDEALPKVGQIIVIPMSEKTPYGFLGKVTSVNKGETINVLTEEVPLAEAFETLSIDKEIDLSECFDGVFDEEGNPIEYEIVDSLFQEPDTLGLNKSQKMTRTGEFYLENHIVSFPVKLFKDKVNANTGIKVTGTAYVGFKKAKLDIDCQDHKMKYVNFEASPVAGLKLNNTVTVKAEAKVSERLGQLRFRPKFVVPVGPVPVPVIVPITFYLYGEFGVKGEATASLTFKTEWNPTWKVELKNDEWVTPQDKGGNLQKKSPWGVVGEFGINGEIYSKAKLGAMVGLYTATSGIGINFCPTYSVSANAKLSSDLLKINPKVEQELSLNSDVYCVAKIFGKQLAKLELDFPKFVLWSEKMYLLPQYENFEAHGNSTLGEISYQIDQHYFLEGLGVKTGTSVFESDQTTLFQSYYPSPTSTDNKGFKSYNVSVNGLKGGCTYYASPLVELPFEIPLVGNKLYGNLNEFTTEANYHAGFRCSGQSYDNIYFDFNINESQSSSLDQTLETHDYDGDLERIHFTANYDANTKQLSGVIDYHFYDNPEERRQDGFTITLPVEDTGYIYCSKVIANSGCDKMVRIYRNGSSAAKAKKYNNPIVVTDCNEGDH